MSVVRSRFMLAGLVACTLAALMASTAEAQNGMQRFTIDGGGGSSASGSYIVSGTVGQPDAGALTGGTYALAGGFWLGGGALSGVEEGHPAQDGGASTLVTGMSPVAPNPMRGSTLLSFRLARPEVVRLEVFNVRGEKVRTLVQGPRTGGSYQIVWDGGDEQGTEAASGLYLIRFAAGAYHAEQKVLLVR